MSSGTADDWSSFSYTPDRRYWKQVSNYLSGGSATTIYVGGILEKVTTSAGTDFRHMIRAGGSSIIVSRQRAGTNSVHYVTSDHLGSSSAITNSSGAILANTSYDAFGSRRDETWASGPTSSDWATIASTTRRGFTDHSMLDNLNLTHMNGRVYDQWLGRFLSADPFIPDPLSTQSYNRYSYVQNNPLTMIDPSGFIPHWGENYPGQDRDPIWDWGSEAQRDNWWGYGKPSEESPCRTPAGGMLSETACLFATGPVGMGAAIANAEAERHRAPPPGSIPGSGPTVTPSDSVAAWSGIGLTSDGSEMRTAAQTFRDYMCSYGIGPCDPPPLETPYETWRKEGERTVAFCGFGCNKVALPSTPIRVFRQNNGDRLANAALILDVATAGSLGAARAIPGKVRQTLETIRRTGVAPPGQVGGRVFRNAGGRLPAGGRYREYDVDPAPGPGGRRNAERLVIDESTGKAWYTDDHYGSFREVGP